MFFIKINAKKFSLVVGGWEIYGKIVSNTHTFSSKSVKKKTNLLVIKIMFLFFSSTSIVFIIAGKLKYRKFNNFF